MSGQVDARHMRRRDRWAKVHWSLVASLVRVPSREEVAVAHKRTTHRSSAGRKVYELRDAKGKLADNRDGHFHMFANTHERGWRQDHRREAIPDRPVKKR